MSLAIGCGGNSADDTATSDSSAAAGRAAAPLPAQDSADLIITDSQTVYVAQSLTGRDYWQVDIFGEGIRYRWAENRTGVVFGAGRVEGDDARSTWTAKRSGDGPKAIQMQLIATSCVDGSRTYQYRVAVLVDGRAMEGCGARGTAAPDSSRTRRP